MDVVARQDMSVVLEVVSDLLVADAFQPRPELRQHRIARQLVGCAGIVVRERYVTRVTLGYCKR